MGASANPILGGLGLVTGLMSNDANRKAQNNAVNSANANRQASLAQQQQMIDMLKERYSLIKDVIEQGKFNGVFNPETQLANYDRDFSKSLAFNQGSLLQSMRSAGFRPGDSEQTNQLNTITAKAMDDRANFANDTRRQSFFDELNAYSALDANSAMGAASIAGNMGQQGTGFNMSLANMYGNRIQNPAGLLSYVMPYLGNQNQPQAQPNPWHGSGSDGASSGSNLGMVGGW